MGYDEDNDDTTPVEEPDKPKQMLRHPNTGELVPFDVWVPVIRVIAEPTRDGLSVMVIRYLQREIDGGFEQEYMGPDGEWVEFAPYEIIQPFIFINGLELKSGDDPYRDIADKVAHRIVENMNMLMIQPGVQVVPAASDN